jgi:hypothetical protein
MQMRSGGQQITAFTFGVIFVTALLVLAVKFPEPTSFQYMVFRIVLALAAGGVGAMIPGFLKVEVKPGIRAGGALAVFVVVFFFNPAKLTGVMPKTELENELATPILRPRHSGVDVSPATEVLVVTRPDALTPPVLSKRYARITIQSTAAQVPDGLTIIADEIEGENGGSLTGNDFSIVARRLANLQVDVNSGPSGRAGSVWIYAKILENDVLSAKGTSGKAGADGVDGRAGADGFNGGNGTCVGFHWVLAADGQDGRKGANGENGEPGGDAFDGGQITVTTEKEPVSTLHAVDGGAGGVGGRGGAPGAGGRGGFGGRACAGNHAHPEISLRDGNAGRPGLPGNPGHNGRSGKDGAAGHYELKIVPNFDPIVATLNRLPNDQIHAALRAL